MNPRFDVASGLAGGLLERGASERIGTPAPSTWIQWEVGPSNGWAWLFALAFLGVSGVVTLRWALERPSWVVGWRIAAVWLAFTAAVCVGRYVTVGRRREPRWLLPVQLAFATVLSWVVWQSSTPGLDLGVGRTGDAVVFGLALIGLVVVADDPRVYTTGQWAALALFAVFMAVFIHHSLAMPPASPLSRHAVWGGVVFGVWLVVLPRQLPSQLVLWALARLAAVVLLLGMGVYAVGPYELFGLQFAFDGAYDVPGLDAEIPAMRSFFVTRNSLAVVAFAGFVSSIIEYTRAVRMERSVVGMLGPSTLVVLTGTGFFLAFGRALWVISPITLLVYFAYLDFGRESIPVTAALSAGYLIAGIAGVYLAWTAGLIERVPGNRFPPWSASVAAILDNLSWLGEGLIDTRAFIDPYGTQSFSPHSSYLGSWIRFGVVGVVAYLCIVLAGLVRGVVRYPQVDVAMLALAMGFAAHQAFESYTMFSWSIGSAIAALSLGFLFFGEWDRRTGPSID